MMSKNYLPLIAKKFFLLAVALLASHSAQANFHFVLTETVDGRPVDVTCAVCICGHTSTLMKHGRV